MSSSSIRDSAWSRPSHATPTYHFTAPEGHCAPFDPNGCLFWGDRFHLFYIYQDPDLPHGGHCWGHASSIDLVTWDYHRPALKPGPEDPEQGIFSGCAMIDRDGRALLVSTLR